MPTLSPTRPARVLVVIVTYNGLAWLDRCLGSLRRSQLPLEVVVIDNGSTDGTPAAIADRFPEVQLIQPGENLGFGKGNNLGLTQALQEGYDYAFLLNQDAWIEPDTVAHLVAVQQQHPSYGVLSPMHLDGNGNALDRLFADYVVPRQCPDLYSDLYVRPHDLAPVYAAQFANAAAWLLSRACLETVGGFDPIFPHYGEDVDYLNRVRYHGVGIGICPAVTICHDRDTSRAISAEQTPAKFRHLAYVKALARLKNPAVSLARGFLREYKAVCLGLMGSLPSAEERHRQWLLARGLWRATQQATALQRQRATCRQVMASFLTEDSLQASAEQPA